MADYNNLQSLADDEIRKILFNEGKKFERIVKSVWRRYEKSYKPVQYIRTGKTEESIELGYVKLISPTEYGIELTFKDDLVYHDSVIKNSKKKGHSFMLISEGWRADKLARMYGGHIYRFTYYNGFNLVDKILKEYKTIKHPSISVEMQWSGKYYYG